VPDVRFEVVLLGMLLSATPAVSLACSCAGMRSMEMALAMSDAVVVGRVERAGDSLVVAVIEPLKGGLAGRIEIATPMMCYQSFAAEDFKVGERYLFPLIEVDLADPANRFFLSFGQIPGEAVGRLFTLPTCSHTALALVGEELYSNELTSDGGRRLEYYASLPPVKFLFWAGLFSIPRLMLLISMTLVLAISIVVWKKRRMRH
jgi:hypothetical protein